MTALGQPRQLTGMADRRSFSPKIISQTQTDDLNVTSDTSNYIDTMYVIENTLLYPDIEGTRSLAKGAIFDLIRDSPTWPSRPMFTSHVYRVSGEKHDVNRDQISSTTQTNPQNDQRNRHGWHDFAMATWAHVHLGCRQYTWSTRDNAIQSANRWDNHTMTKETVKPTSGAGLPLISSSILFSIASVGIVFCPGEWLLSFHSRRQLRESATTTRGSESNACQRGPTIGHCANPYRRLIHIHDPLWIGQSRHAKVDVAQRNINSQTLRGTYKLLPCRVNQIVIHAV